MIKVSIKWTDTEVLLLAIRVKRIENNGSRGRVTKDMFILNIYMSYFGKEVEGY